MFSSSLSHLCFSGFLIWLTDILVVMLMDLVLGIHSGVDSIGKLNKTGPYEGHHTASLGFFSHEVLLISCLKYRFHKELLWRRSLSGKTNCGEMAQLRNSLYFSTSNGKLCYNLCPVGRVCRLGKGPHCFWADRQRNSCIHLCLAVPRTKCCKEGVFNKSHLILCFLSQWPAFSWMHYVQNCSHSKTERADQTTASTCPTVASKSFKLFSASSITESLTAFQETLPQESTFSIKLISTRTDTDSLKTPVLNI